MHINRFEMLYQFTTASFVGLAFVVLGQIVSLVLLGGGSIHLWVNLAIYLFLFIANFRSMRSCARDWKSMSDRFEKGEGLVPSENLLYIVKGYRKRRPLLNLLICVLMWMDVVTLFGYSEWHPVSVNHASAVIGQYDLSVLVTFFSLNLVVVAAWLNMHLVSVDDIDPTDRKKISLNKPSEVSDSA